MRQSLYGDVVEAHCYVVDIRQIDLEQLCDRINKN